MGHSARPTAVALGARVTADTAAWPACGTTKADAMRPKTPKGRSKIAGVSQIWANTQSLDGAWLHGKKPLRNLGSYQRCPGLWLLSTEDLVLGGFHFKRSLARLRISSSPFTTSRSWDETKQAMPRANLDASESKSIRGVPASSGLKTYLSPPCRCWNLRPLSCQQLGPETFRKLIEKVLLGFPLWAEHIRLWNNSSLDCRCRGKLQRSFFRAPH